MKRLALIVIAMGSLLPAQAGAELVLLDDTVIGGTTVERDEDFYLLELEGGEILTIPVALVSEVRLFEGEEPEPEPPATPPSGFKVTKGETLAGPDEVEQYPKVAEQLDAFGEPSRFRRSPTNPFWRPRSDWDLDPSQNDFNPSRWYESPLNPYWEPRSAFDGDVDVLEPRRTRWRSSFSGSYWYPTDGFASSSFFD